MFDAADVSLRIVWFHRDPVGADVDNVLKPIADSLNEIVYTDDRQIARCSAERISWRYPIEIVPSALDDTTYQELIDALADATVPNIFVVLVGPRALVSVDV